MKTRASFHSLLSANWQSGLTVALVSIPLSISLSIAANATPVMGMITAVWAGLFAAFFGGSRFNIVGPAAALSGILASYALMHGVASLPWIAVVSGVLILIANALHWEKYIAFIPGSVVHGFTLAVGVIIGLNQLNFAFGLQGLVVHEEFIFNVAESLRHLPQAHLPTVGIFAVCLAFLFAWQRWVKAIPGAIPLAAAGVALGFGAAKFGALPGMQTLFTRFGEFDTALIAPQGFSWAMVSRAFVSTSATVALIAMLETLLSAKVADGMTHTKFHRSREMLGLGLANIAAGLAGGLPATGVFVRTAINVRSGATHRLSQGINAVCVAVICFFFLAEFRYLPLAVVAAILVFSAMRMVQHEHFVRLYRQDRPAFWLSMGVAALSIAFDPMVGILVGASSSLLLFIHTMSKGQAEVTINRQGAIAGRHSIASFLHTKPHQGDVFVYRFAGPLNYVNAQAHAEVLDALSGPHTVVLAFRNLFFMDLDGLDALEDMVDSLESRGIRVACSGIGDLLRPLLATSSLYRRKERAGLIYESTSQAVKALEKLGSGPKRPRAKGAPRTSK